MLVGGTDDRRVDLDMVRAMAQSADTVQKEAIATPIRNVVLTDHQDSPVDRLIKSSRYQNASEVLRESLRLVELEDAENDARMEALRDSARVGIADVKAGRIQSFRSAEELGRHFCAIAASAITSAHEHDKDVVSQGNRKDVPPNA